MELRMRDVEAERRLLASEAVRSAVNALHETLSSRTQAVPGACRRHLETALIALRSVRDLTGTMTLYACILDLEIMLIQKTKVKLMVPRVLDILEKIDHLT